MALRARNSNTLETGMDFMSPGAIERRLLQIIPLGLRNYLGVDPSSEHAGELLSGSVTAFVYKVIGVACGYFFTFLITRYYGTYVMGVFAIALTVLDIFSVLGRLGLETALLRFVAEYSAQEGIGLVRKIYLKALSVALPVSAGFAVLLYCLSYFLAQTIFKNESLTAYFRVGAVAIPMLSLFSLHIESIRGLKRISEYSVLQNVLIPLFSGLLLLFSTQLMKDSFLPFASYMTAVLVVSLLSIIKWVKLSGFSSSPVEGNFSARSLLSVSLPMLLSSSLFLIIGYTDTIMLGMQRSGQEVGIYSVAMKVAALASFTLVAINSIAAPKFAEFYGRGDMKGLETVARQSTRLIFWSSLPVLVATALFPSSILGLFGADFRAGTYALLMLTVGQFVNAISGSVGYILQMTGRQGVFQKIILLATGMNVGLNLLLIPRFGFNGAAFASMVSLIFWNLCSVVYIRSRYKITTLYVPGLKYRGLFQ